LSLVGQMDVAKLQSCGYETPARIGSAVRRVLSIGPVRH
jgi:hypothetical protein